MQVPAFDLKRQYRQIGLEVTSVVGEVMAGGQFILGNHVGLLEEEIATFCGTRFGIGVANGSDAIHLALLALGIGPGDEVVVPSFTFFATGGAVARAGATPVFADVDPVTYTLCPQSFEQKITARTRAVIPVHLYGNPTDMGRIVTIAHGHGIKIVEDGAQAIGARYRDRGIGSFGDVATLSFFPTKNLGAFGDGGMIITNDEELAERARMLRTHGAKQKYYHEEMGYNSRLDELQAAILRTKLKYLPEWTAARQQISKLYDELLSGLPIQLPRTTPEGEHVYHQYTITTGKRDHLLAFLRDNGVGSTIYYPRGLHQQPVFEKMGLALDRLQVTEQLCQTALSLPMFPEMNVDEVEHVAATIRKWAMQH